MNGYPEAQIRRAPGPDRRPNLTSRFAQDARRRQINCGRDGRPVRAVACQGCMREPGFAARSAAKVGLGGQRYWIAVGFSVARLSPMWSGSTNSKSRASAGSGSREETINGLHYSASLTLRRQSENAGSGVVCSSPRTSDRYRGDTRRIQR